jgi:molybdate transport system ATP-binding protein
VSLVAKVRVRRDGFLLDASLRVPAGRTVALLGPNGAGKSTFVATLAGLQPIDAGRIVLNGRSLEDPAAGTRIPAQDRQVGVVFQDLLLFPHLSAIENVAFPLRTRGIPRSEARARAQALLDRLGVGSRAGGRPGELSGGEAQRVALARALIHEPQLLLLDEPLSSLDVRARTEIRALVRSTLTRFSGVRVLVTHDPVEAMTVADELVLLENGRVTQKGTPEDVRATPRTRYAAELVGLNLFMGRLVRLEEGAGQIQTPDGNVVVAWPADTVEADAVLGILRPSDVSLYRSRPEGSARNVVRGSVTSVSIEADRARVRVASSPPVVADVTPGSVTRLGLTEGVEVWASFKAVKVSVVTP